MKIEFNIRYWAILLWSLAMVQGLALSQMQNACALSGDASVGAVDVQPAINMALGLTACTTNIDAAGNVVVVQRVIDAALGGSWGSAGVSGGIPARLTQCGSTIAVYNGSASTINTAISNCPAGQFVSLGAGTSNLNIMQQVTDFISSDGNYKQAHEICRLESIT